jgi:hypothetical protein
MFGFTYNFFNGAMINQLISDNDYFDICLDCKVSRNGREYRGKRSRTHTGKACQRWDSDIPNIIYGSGCEYEFIYLVTKCMSIWQTDINVINVNVTYNVHIYT